tara:strand:- start:480 stop:3605 length:3126 start_codon:yes stop_codon:yes gene_type:complete
VRKIIEFFVRNPLFSDLLTVFVIGVGIVSAFLIRREAFPVITFDIVQVTALWPGSSSADIEKLITNPIEQDLQEVDGIDKLQSTSIENMSVVAIFLDPDETTDKEGKDDVQDVIDKLEDYPTEAEKPNVFLLDSSRAPIIEVTIASDDLTDLELREKARDLEKEIERIPGVAKVVHKGLRDLEVRVEISPQRLSHYRLSLQEVVSALSQQNVSIPGGIIEPKDLNSPERLVRTVGEFNNLDDIRNTVIRANDLGRPIEVKDVAKVYYDLEKAEVVHRTNGKKSLSLTILKQEFADAINVVDAVKDKMETLHGGLLSGLDVASINDMSEYVRRRLGVLTGNMAIGLSLILLFLPILVPFRFALVISLGLPMAFLGTVFILYNTGVSINLLTMMGLIIVSGILVDDSIVVTENAARLVDEGKSPRDAAIEGTAQIAPALVASVMTTAFAFLPMMFMSGIMGKFIKFIPLAILIALMISLFEAFFILPSHVANWIRFSKDGSHKPGFMDRFYGPIRKNWDDFLIPRYMKLIRKAVEHRYWILAGAFGFFLATLALAFGGMKLVLFPPEGIEIFFIRTETKVGESIESHVQKLRPIEKIVQSLPKEELKDFTTTVGLVQQDPNDPETKRGGHYAQISVYLTPESSRDRRALEIIDDLRAKTGHPEGFERVTFERAQGGPPTGKAVSLGVRADEYEDILPAVEDLKEILAGINGVTDIQDSYRMGKEEVQVIPKAGEAQAAGVSTETIGSSVRAAYGGLIATKLRKLDEEVDIRVSWPLEVRESASAIDQVLVPNKQGNLIPLSRVADFKTTRNIAAHNHEGNSRQIRVLADVDERVITSTEANNKVREQLTELRKKHPKVRIEFGGEDEDTQESLASLGRSFGVAVLLIFLMLVLIFKSLVQPFLVLLTIPLGIIAVIWTFFLHGMPISFLGLLGIIALAGVIVNNAIILMDFYNQHRDDGLGPVEGILEASKQRIRPIVMTSLTTVMGILPTAYGIGGLDQFVVPIAMSLGWGVLFGAAMTTIVFPCALVTLEDIYAWKKRRFS